ncbi:sporulation protein, YlmC/YmxH family [Geosporobacter subterraneus DSM 17957]|uniref:Sporulation protein, YlmC/YmxH family n=1 Tax=Geosporobacter subterraneus DSM 17957 TaxID=1121919 RepID=A0A1M6DZP9_9FIRM|nr:YlmC/YmxH family sporulation protein [Geosporobacter subterraneus]SHI78671.1 sporulation protein, YlmC/YmxH family [Geosporobacter subterraneus DSM 17957]
MRLSKLGGKEIVNLNDGGRLGVLAESDLLVDERNGKIRALLVPDFRNQFSIFSDKSFVEIPWEYVRKIGNDMIIIEMEDEKSSRRSFSL